MTARPAPEEVGEILSPDELDELAECERVISDGRKVFLAVGNALATIRDERLYRAEFGTFDDYCRERWQMGPSSAYRMIDAYNTVTIIAEISPIGEKIENEAQARALSGLLPETAVQALEMASEGGKLTAARIEAAVEKIAPKPNPMASRALDAMLAPDDAPVKELRGYRVGERVLYLPDGLEPIGTTPKTIPGILVDVGDAKWKGGPPNDRNAYGYQTRPFFDIRLDPTGEIVRGTRMQIAHPSLVESPAEAKVWPALPGVQSAPAKLEVMDKLCEIVSEDLLENATINMPIFVDGVLYVVRQVINLSDLGTREAICLQVVEMQFYDRQHPAENADDPGLPVILAKWQEQVQSRVRTIEDFRGLRLIVLREPENLYFIATGQIMIFRYLAKGKSTKPASDPAPPVPASTDVAPAIEAAPIPPAADPVQNQTETIPEPSPLQQDDLQKRDLPTVDTLLPREVAEERRAWVKLMDAALIRSRIEDKDRFSPRPAQPNAFEYSGAFFDALERIAELEAAGITICGDSYTKLKMIVSGWNERHPAQQTTPSEFIVMMIARRFDEAELKLPGVAE